MSAHKPRCDCDRCIPEWTRCIDCGIQTMPDSPLGSHDWQRYMVRDYTWWRAGMETSNAGWLCIPCLEARLIARHGRPLSGADFPPLPINRPGRDDDTPRLAELKQAGWTLYATAYGRGGAS
jgi:hypothetical protein